MSQLVEYFKNRKNLRNLIILLVLVVGLPIGIYLAQRTQILRSRAANDPIIFTGPNVRERNGQSVVVPDRTGPDGKPIYKVDILLTAPTSPLPAN